MITSSHFTFCFKKLYKIRTTKVDRSVMKHLNIQGRPNPRRGLYCFWYPNKTWTPPLDASNTIRIIKNWLEMKKLQPHKVKRVKKKLKTTKHQTLQKSIPKHANDFANDFLCVAIRVQRWFVKLQVELTLKVLTLKNCPKDMSLTIMRNLSKECMHAALGQKHLCVYCNSLAASHTNYIICGKFETFKKHYFQTPNFF
jgi:hypothetical protein